MIRTILHSILVLALVSPIQVLAAKGGKGNGSGSGGGDDGGSSCTADPGALFPALIYTENGENFVASSDGCTIQSLGSVGGKLTYHGSGSGHIVWHEANELEESVWRQNFDVDDINNEVVLNGSPELLYQYTGTTRRIGFVTVRGNFLVAGAEDFTSAGQGEFPHDGPLFVVDLANCSASPCDASDEIQIYNPDDYCLSVPMQDGCFWAEYPIISADGNTVFFTMMGSHINGGRVHAIGRATAQAGDWNSPTVEVFLTEDNYPGLVHPSLSANDQYLKINYDAGNVIFDLANTSFGCPCEAFPGQIFSGAGAVWTVDDTLYLTERSGKGRKISFPIEEFDPFTGTNRSLGITLSEDWGFGGSSL